MATTLRYLDEILANLPDNTAKLITPENVRDGFASVKVGLGYMYSTTEVTVAIDPDVWVALNPLLVNVTVADELWTFDANNYAKSDYTTLSNVIVPAGYSKVLSIRTLVNLDKAGGGSDPYEFQYTKNGVGIGQVEPVIFRGTPQLETFMIDTLADISTADTYGLQVRGVGTGDDFDMQAFSMQLFDSYLASAPGGP
jgi:hypothetical protein